MNKIYILPEEMLFTFLTHITQSPKLLFLQVEMELSTSTKV